MSDVFGSLVKQHKRGQTADAGGLADRCGGLDAGVKGDALRSMKAPGTAYDDPIVGKDPQPGAHGRLRRHHRGQRRRAHQLRDPEPRLLSGRDHARRVRLGEAPAGSGTRRSGARATRTRRASRASPRSRSASPNSSTARRAPRPRPSLGAGRRSACPPRSPRGCCQPVRLELTRARDRRVERNQVDQHERAPGVAGAGGRASRFAARPSRSRPALTSARWWRRSLPVRPQR